MLTISLSTFQPLLVILTLQMHSFTWADCPHLCECKWKSGKESVICTSANLSAVPVHLDSSTQILDLTSNNLPTLRNDEFSQAELLNLQKIFVSRCKLKTLEKYAFRHLINLVELDLSYNILSSVPSHTFQSISELRELKLSGNPIQKITNDAFANVPQLVRLELAECKIITIEPRAFSGLEKSLEWLKLDHNRLVVVQPTSLTILHSLHELDLSGNPWNCSCTLRPLREWMLKNNIPSGIPPVCQYPKRLQSKPWDKLDLDEFACVPEIFAYEAKAHGVEGKNVTMTCRITGVPAPNVRWSLKNKVIANLSGTPYTNGKKLYVVQLHNTSLLTILTADLQDAGTYVCAAENKAGRAEASVTLAVSKKPPENTMASKVLLVSVVAGVFLAVGSCLLVVCMWSVRKKQSRRWSNRDCLNEDNYEKIEMNNKSETNNGRTTTQSDVSVVGSLRKNGEYRVVPGADTDDDDEDSVMLKQGIKETKFITAQGNGEGWTEPLEDLHIPRRKLPEIRDDFKRKPNLTSGIYNPPTTSFLPSSSVPSSSSSYQPIIKKPLLDSTGIYTSTYSSDLSILAESELEQKYPDLLENSSSPKKFCSKANSEGGSVQDINEIFCTLPRKKALLHNSKYISSDSQSPLLPESRYGSSGGESTDSRGFGSRNSCRRLSDFQKFSEKTELQRQGELPKFQESQRSFTNSKQRPNQRSNSYLNLSRTSGPPSPIHEFDTLKATPLLDVSNLESKVYPNKHEVLSPTSSMPSNANSYDYHAAQLERFLEEYRSLQKQLTKMKETCDNLRHDKNKYLDPLLQNSLPVTPTVDEASMNKKGSVVMSPNANQSFAESLRYPSYESDLSRLLLTKNGGMYNNK